MRALYEELYREIDAIRDSTLLRRAREEYGIGFVTEFVPVDSDKNDLL